MPIARLYPNRTPIPTLDPSGTRLKFAGYVGCKTGGVDKISLFWPMRTEDGRILLQGKGPDGKILYGYTYRDESGKLMGATLAEEGFTTSCECTACYLVVTVSGFPDGMGSGICSRANFTGLNGTHTLTLNVTGCEYAKVPTNYYWWYPYSECTIAESFPNSGIYLGPLISVSPWFIELWGRVERDTSPCWTRVSTGLSYLENCVDLANYIGHTWDIPIADFTVSLRLDAFL